MLKSLVITSGSGLVLFEKEWVKDFEQPAKWGGLIRALEEFSVQCVGLPVTYMEFPNVAVTVSMDTKTNLICTLFHDLNDMQELGGFIANEILNTFKETFRDKDFNSSFVKGNQYVSFSNKLYDCVNNTQRSIIWNLQQQKGIVATLLVYDDGTDAIAEGQLDDKLSVIANFQALQTIADQTLGIQREDTTFMSLEMPKKFVFVHRVGGSASLVTICKKNVEKSVYSSRIETAVKLLNKDQEEMETLLIKKDDDSNFLSFHKNDKGIVLQDMRIFNQKPIKIKQCYDILVRFLHILMYGEKISSKEATDIFFSVTKLFQVKDVALRRMVHLVIKELSKLSEDTIIAVAILTKDITNDCNISKANAIRAISRIIDPSMLNQIDRYIKTAIIDKDPYVSSSSLVSVYHLFKKNPEVIKRWTSEIQEASQSRYISQYHALGLLYQLRQNDLMSVSKLLHTLINSPSKLNLTTCLLIKIAYNVLKNQSHGKRDDFLMKFIYSCLKNSDNMVVVEAAKQLSNLPGLSSSELMPVITSLQAFLSSSKPILRFTSIKTISKIVTSHPETLTDICINELENLLNDPNRFISTMAATTLLQAENESIIERLLNLVSGFIEELNDEYKIQVVEGIRKLYMKFPSFSLNITNTLSKLLKMDGDIEYKQLIVDTLIGFMKENYEHKNTILECLSEYIEDCEYSNLITKILHLLGEEGPSSVHPMKYIRSIYNRMILETESVRASAVDALARYSSIEADIVKTLLIQCVYDKDDQVRDKATYYLNLLQEKVKSPEFDINSMIKSSINIPIENLEAYLNDFINNGLDINIDISSIPADIIQPKHQVETNKHEVNKVKPNRDVLKVQNLFQNLGELIKSSRLIPLTEEETEYQVSLIKHIFPNHVVLEFLITNTLEDISIKNVYMDIEPTIDLWIVEHRVIIDKFIQKNETESTYIVLPIPEVDVESSKFNCSLKFEVFEIDPMNFEIIEESSTFDEYPVDSFIL